MKVLRPSCLRKPDKTKKTDNDVIERMAGSAQRATGISSGTSGWTFRFWDAHTDFYTDESGKRIRGSRQLSHYASKLRMVELNATFYRVPSEKVWTKWRDRARAFEGNFVFCLKMNRFATHSKLLKEPETWWPSFWKRATLLEDRLGPILFQLPPRFAATEENIARLESLEGVLPQSHPFVFEFRNSTWKREHISDLFERTRWSVAVVHVCNKTAPWARQKKSWTKLDEGWTDLELSGRVHYIRLHGTEGQYAGTYQGKLSGEELIDRLLSLTRDGRSVYVAFNNTDSYELMHSGSTLPSAIADACAIEQIFNN